MAKKSQKQLDTSVRITYKDGRIEEYSNLQEASEKSGLSESAIKIRCNKSRHGGSNKKDKISCMWINDTTFRSYQAKKSKNKGASWEYELIKMFKEAGYDDCVTSRGESKILDNSKIDIISKSLPFYCQAKNLVNTPSYFKISEECPLKDLPFVICWKKSDEQGKAIAMVPMDFFLKLIDKKNFDY